jgi:hypothetical protein
MDFYMKMFVGAPLAGALVGDKNGFCLWQKRSEFSISE